MKPLSTSIAILLALTITPLRADDAKSGLTFTIERSVAHKGFDGKTCWVHARAGAIPASAIEGATQPRVVMTMQKLLLTGSDVFYELHGLVTNDGAKTWTGPHRYETFLRQKREPDIEITVCDFTPKWHAKSGKLLGTGQTVWYRGNKVMPIRERAVAYAIYDPRGEKWTAWKSLVMPDEKRFGSSGAGSVQRLDLPDGDVLLPIYFKEPREQQYSVTVVRAKFDGDTLTYLKHGSELTVPVKRGFAEPSLTRFAGRYYLTLRNDEAGYVTSGDDGLIFDKPRKWTFDDGSDLGNYNTQQHWVTHRDGLFLVYTRKAADNDHVFRHRAPLFIARVDPAKLCVIRATEQVLVPERGARLGNFGVVEVSENETWVTAAEWMQPAGVEKRGSDNSIHIVKLKWSRPNR